MFNVGDIVVYPAHGVSEVESIESREISGSTISFFILKVLDTEMTVMVPVTNVENVGIRRLLDEKGIERVLDILKERSVPVDNQTWNRRYREYMEKIKSGSAFEIAEVLRDLNILKRGKELSFGERKMYDTARNLLVSEIAISLKLDKKEVEKMLLEAMGKLEPQAE